jgi:hypothetical protein
MFGKEEREKSQEARWLERLKILLNYFFAKLTYLQKSFPFALSVCH